MENVREKIEKIVFGYLDLSERAQDPGELIDKITSLITEKSGGAEVPCNVGLCATTQANLKGEILDRMNHFYLQTNGVYHWPNNAEGDILKMAHKFISA